MRFAIIPLLTIAILTSRCIEAYGSTAGQRIGEPLSLEVVIHSDYDRALVEPIKSDLESSRREIERFFAAPFKDRIVAEMFPSRKALDVFVKKVWSAPPTEKWMVAAGVADVLVVLSPRVWATESVDHDPYDPAHRKGILAHELVHVFHGQHNINREFDGMDDLGWFVEGLATYVSGQLEREHKTDAEEAIKAGKAPTNLKGAWSGRYRYGVCGSMARYIDKRYGRNMLWQLLKVTKPDEALSRLGTTESSFLISWRDFVMDEAGHTNGTGANRLDTWN
jgi:hypothetical protein